MSAQILNFKEEKRRRERERRKVSPQRLALVKQMWGPEEIERLHEELEAWGW
jgi:hypothetical protein